MEKFLRRYLDKNLSKYELFLLGSDVAVLTTLEDFIISWSSTQQDLLNYFGLTAHICDTRHKFKTAITNIALNHYSKHKISIHHYKSICEVYDRHFDNDFDFYT